MPEHRHSHSHSHRRASLKRQSLTLSPPAWKDQLRQRCLQRLKQDRRQLLARLRRPDARSVSEEMQRLVAHEQQRQEEDDGVSVDDLLLLGRLKEDDYLEIVHALEDALRQEEDDGALLAQQRQALEDAELEALLAGMDLEDEHSWDDHAHVEEAGVAPSVLCPSCKAGYLREHTAETAASLPFVSCDCGFTFHVQYVYHGVLEDFQDKIVSAFMTHRDRCSSDPTFVKMVPTDLHGTADVLCIKCTDCGCDHMLR